MRHATIVGIFTLMLALIPGLVFAEPVIDDSKSTSYLFVINGTSSSLDENTLALNGVPSVIYFTDRPARKVGYMSLSNFLDMWDKNIGNFKADPPNAALSILKKDEAKEVVVELKSAEQKNGTLLFKVRVLEGNAAGSFETSTLFIDSFGPCPGC